VTAALAQPRTTNWRGRWIPGAFYARGDVVDYGNTKYTCIADTNSPTPPPQNPRDWQASDSLLLLVGSAMIWTPGQLTAMSLVTPTDYGSAESVWRASVPPSWGGALAGRAWDRERQTYGGKSSATLKTVSLAFAASVAADLALAAEPLIEGDAPIEVWQAKFGRQIKSASVAMGAFAVGGFRFLTAADLRTLFGEIRYGLRKLRRFARATEHGDSRAGSEDAIRYRSTLYGERLNTLYELIRRDSHGRVRGPTGQALYTEELNVLGHADHCDKRTPEGQARPEPGCVQETARGWVRIGALSRPGDRLCKMMCRCSLKYRGDVDPN
jgi:hypothetical protein